MSDKKVIALKMDVEVYDKEDAWVQGNYVVQGYEDIIWANDKRTALAYFVSELERYEPGWRNVLNKLRRKGDV